MTKKFIIPVLGTVLVLLLLVGGFIYINNSMSSPDQIDSAGLGSAETDADSGAASTLPGDANTDPNAVSGLNPDLNGDSITLAEVQTNNTLDSCYVIVSDSVYAVPRNYIDQHPGGVAPFVNGCGGDMTQAFMGQHATSDEANNKLTEYYLGELVR